MIFVLVEHIDGEISAASMEILSKAGELAASLDTKVCVVILGNDSFDKAELLVRYGEVIFVCNKFLEKYTASGYSKVLTGLIDEYKPEIFLMASTSMGRDLAPKVAARLKAPLISDCTDLSVDAETRRLIMARPGLNGDHIERMVYKYAKIQIATVRPGIFKINEKSCTVGGNLKKVDAYLSEEDVDLIVNEEIDKKQYVDISQAKVLISGGRGICDNLKMIYDLADVLGAEVASSRANVEAGLISKDRQVGQTGKIVRPVLYLACGISGAMQHVVGMAGAKMVIAINKSRKAPIFAVSDLGIVSDANDIIPKLTEAILKRTSKRLLGK